MTIKEKATIKSFIKLIKKKRQGAKLLRYNIHSLVVEYSDIKEKVKEIEKLIK